MGEVKCLPGTGDVHPDAILEMAKGQGLAEVVVLGRDKDGDLAIWGSTSELKTILWMVVNAEHWIIQQAGEVDDDE